MKKGVCYLMRSLRLVFALEVITFLVVWSTIRHGVVGEVIVSEHKSQVVASTIEPPDISLKIPVDIYHLIDQSGSIDSAKYLEYLEFAQNLTHQLVSQIGLDSASNPGLRVSLLGFGCKLSSTADMTEFFLHLESDVNTINSQFQAARHGQYHPDYPRTCLRYVLQHIEDAIYPAVSARSSESAEPIERSVVLVMYSDGESGDFTWNGVKESPVFNSPEAIETFAVGVSEREQTKIADNLIKDAANVFTSTENTALQKIVRRVSSFAIDPFKIPYELYRRADVQSTDGKLAPEQAFCVGQSFSLGFNLANLSEIAANSSTAPADEQNQSGILPQNSVKEAKSQLLRQIQTGMLSFSERNSLLQLFTEEMSNDVFTDSLRAVYAEHGSGLSEADRKKLDIRDSAPVLLCEFESDLLPSGTGKIVQAYRTLQTAVPGLELENMYFCDLPDTLLEQMTAGAFTVEDLTVRLYLTREAEAQTEKAFDNLLSLFSFAVPWQACVTSQVLLSTTGCGENHMLTSIAGETVQHLLERNKDLPETEMLQVVCDVRPLDAQNVSTRVYAVEEVESSGTQSEVNFIGYGCDIDLDLIELRWFYEHGYQVNKSLDGAEVVVEISVLSSDDSMAVSLRQDPTSVVHAGVSSCASTLVSDTFDVCLGSDVQLTYSPKLEQLKLLSQQDPAQAENAYFCAVSGLDGVERHVPAFLLGTGDFSCSLSYLLYMDAAAVGFVVQHKKVDTVRYLDLAGRSSLSVATDRKGCFEAELLTFSNTCNSDRKQGMRLDMIRFTGSSVSSMGAWSPDQFQAWCELADPVSNLSAKVEARFIGATGSVEGAGLICKSDGNYDLVSTEVSLQLEFQTKRVEHIGGFSSETADTVCVSHKMIANSEEVADVSTSLCAGHELTVELSELFLHRMDQAHDLLQLDQLNCLWYSAADVVEMSRQVEVVGDKYFCTMPHWNATWLSKNTKINFLKIDFGQTASSIPYDLIPLPETEVCIAAGEGEDLSQYLLNATLSQGQSSCWPYCCERPSVSVGFAGDTLSSVAEDSDSTLMCRFMFAELPGGDGQSFQYTLPQSTSSGEVLCSSFDLITVGKQSEVEESHSFPNITAIELLARQEKTRNDVVLSQHAFPVATAAEVCIDVSLSNLACKEQAYFLVYGVTLGEMLQNKNAYEVDMSCSLTLEVDPLVNSNETSLVYSLDAYVTSYSAANGVTSYEVRCDFESVEKSQESSDALDALRELIFEEQQRTESNGELSGFELVIEVSDAENQTRTMVYPLNFEYSREADADCSEAGLDGRRVEYAPLVSGLFGSSLVFGLGCFFVFKGNTALLRESEKKQRHQKQPLKEQHFPSRNLSFDYNTEDLLDVIIEKERKLFSSSTFALNDVVSINLHDADTAELDNQLNKLGIIVNKKIDHSIVKYEVKLLSDLNIIITDLTERDLTRFHLQPGELVEAMDEDMEGRWNTGTVIRYDRVRYCCDIKQGTTRLNEVPLFCLRKASEPGRGNLYQQASREENDLVVVELPAMKGTGYGSENLIDVKSSLKSAIRTEKNERNMFSEVGYRGGSLLSQSSIGSSNSQLRSKRVKFASNISIEKWRPPPRNRTHSEYMPEQKGLYRRKDPLSYEELSEQMYEIRVDVTKGLGVCWGFDPVDGGIVVGKFVDVNSGDWGALEASGKVGLKDKLESVEGKPVSQLRSLAKVRETIKHARKEKREVTFVFSRV